VACAPDAEASVKVDYRGDMLTFASRAVEGDDRYTTSRYIYKIGNELIASNSHFSTGDNSPYRGQGTDTFAHQVQALASVGVKRIETFASRLDGANGLNGYYTWPRMGYDADIPDHLRETIPKEINLKADGTLLDLFQTQAGRDWWKKHGEAIDVEFDLTPGSRSMRVLDAYLAERKSRGAKQ
jgi:hypothetical protein